MNNLAPDRRRWVRARMAMLCGLLGIGLGLVVSAGYDLMIRDGEAWHDLAAAQRQRRLHIIPKRGTIYDRNGSALAVSVEVPSVSLDAYALLRGVAPQQVPFVARRAANRIAAVLSLDPAAVERKILRKRRFAWLKRRISAKEAEGIRRLSSQDAGDDRIAGLIVEGEGHRYYPRRELAGTLLGFVAPDGEGKDGLELAQNEELKGHIDQLRGLRDRSGRLIFANGLSDDQALAGHNLYLSIDQGIQYVAERELANTVRTFEAIGGSVIAVDPNTGEILAAASWPSYNPNDYTDSDPGQRRDRGVSDVFEPGSTMKIFTAAAGLAAGVITPEQRMYCEKGAMMIDNIVIRDTHPAEWLTLSKILSHSSNICAAKIGLSLGPDKLYDALRRFGFGERTGIPVPGEASGTLRPRGRSWVQVETAEAAFGQGIGITTLQLAMGVAAIANGGNLMEPILIDKVTTANGEVVRKAAPHVRRRVVSRRIAKTLAELLVGVTEAGGTGVEAAIKGFQVAGKTATAQKADPATGRYSLDHFVSSFVGFVPAQHPVVTIAVMVDEPMINHAGGSVAAPIFRRVARMALKYKGLTPSGTERADLRELSHEPDPANAAYALLRQADGKGPPIQEIQPSSGSVPKGKVRIPDMTGWPMRRALKQSLELGMRPKVQGSGLIARQEPPPGKVVDKGTPITLVFEPAS